MANSGQLLLLFFKVTHVLIKKFNTAQAGVAQWTEHQPENRKVAGLMLGLWTRCPVGVCERQLLTVSLAHRCFFPSLSSPLPSL